MPTTLHAKHMLLVPWNGVMCIKLISLQRRGMHGEYKMSAAFIFSSYIYLWGMRRVYVTARV